MSPPKYANGNGDSELCWPEELTPYEGLASIENSGEGQHGRALFQLYEVITKSSFQAVISMPHRKKMMSDQANASYDHKTAPNPQGMAKAPENLTNGLRVSANPDDSGGIKTDLRLQDSGNLQQVVSGWI